jgi:uncharacterized protein
VDVGLGNDALLHKSNMCSNQLVQDPHCIVAVGDWLKLRVSEIEVGRGRVGVAMMGSR